MKFILKAYSIWEYGQRKDSHGNPHQEDSLFPAFGQQSDSDRLFVLCDGMGGHAAGEVASAEVCKAMSRFIGANCPDPEGDCPMFVVIDAVSAAFDALDGHHSLGTRGMGTTMTMLKLHSHGATIAHIGDSRVYHIRPGQTADQTIILHKTQDHSLVNDLLRHGKITPEEARDFPRKNIITRAMQPMLQERPEAEIYRTDDIRPGDYFYLCSDGMLEQDDMNYGSGLQHVFSAEIASDPDRVAFLRGATCNNRDNHTAFIVHILDVIHDGSEQKPEEPQVEISEYEPDPVEVVPDEDEHATPTNPPAINPAHFQVLQDDPIITQVATPASQPPTPTPAQPLSQSAQQSAATRPAQPQRPATTRPVQPQRPAATAPAQQPAPRAARPAPQEGHARTAASVEPTNSDDHSFFDSLSDELDSILRSLGIKDRRLGAMIFALIVVAVIIIILCLILFIFDKA